MNQLERDMVSLLRRGKAECGFDAVKAEFEAEGTRHDEFLRLLHIARLAGLKVALKIGGCEAIRDLCESRQYGVEYIIAPMVETPYALSKFIAARNKVYPLDDQCDTAFLFNLETATSYRNLDAMISVAAQGGLSGVVFGRVDFAGSMSQSRDAVDGPEVMGMVQATARACRAARLDLVVGGAVTTKSVAPLTELQSIHLTRYETRKVVFDATNLPKGEAATAIQLAGQFELRWLENKHAYYRELADEDHSRLGMLKARFA